MQIVHGDHGQLTDEDLIPDRLSLIAFSSRGYIKRMTPDHFSVQVLLYLDYCYTLLFPPYTFLTLTAFGESYFGKIVGIIVACLLLQGNIQLHHVEIPHHIARITGKVV